MTDILFYMFMDGEIKENRVVILNFCDYVERNLKKNNKNEENEQK